MKNFKNTILFLLMFCCVISAAAVPVMADASVVDSGNCGVNGDNLSWTLYSDGLLRISGTGNMASYTANAEGSTAPWGDYRSSIKTVVVSENVTSIGDQTFYNFKEITSVSLPDSLRSIGEYSFTGCDKIKEIRLPEHLESIGFWAFMYSSVPRIFYDGTAEQWNKISGVSDSGLNLPIVAYLKESSGGADLSVLDENNTNAQGILFTLDDESHTAFVGDDSYGYNNSNYHGSDNGHAVIPDTVSKNGIPYTVIGIGRSAFERASGLKTIETGGNIESIGTDAFTECFFLEAIKIPESDRYYDTDEYGVLYSKDHSTLLFYPASSGLQNYSIPDATTSIGRYAFCSCLYLENLYIPASVTSLNNNAIKLCENTLFFVQDDSEAYSYVSASSRKLSYQCIGNAAMTGISICTLPERTVLTHGTSPDLTGLYVTRTLSDGSQTITMPLNLFSKDDYHLSFNDTAGVQTATISCGGFTAEFELLVLDPGETAIDFGALELPAGAFGLAAFYDESGRMTGVSDASSVNGHLMAAVSTDAFEAADNARLFRLSDSGCEPLFEKAECGK